MFKKIILFLICLFGLVGIIFANYNIDRLETVPDSKGVVEVFFSITITDELGIYHFAKWLKPIEANTYFSDNTKINSIIDSYLIEAKQHKQNEINNINMDIENVGE